MFSATVRRLRVVNPRISLSGFMNQHCRFSSSAFAQSAAISPEERVSMMEKRFHQDLTEASAEELTSIKEQFTLPSIQYSRPDGEPTWYDLVQNVHKSVDQLSSAQGDAKNSAAKACTDAILAAAEYVAAAQPGSSQGSHRASSVAKDFDEKFSHHEDHHH